MVLKIKMVIFLALLMIFSADSVTLAAQYGTLQLNIKIEPMTIKDYRFYVKEIIDGRKDKKIIGYANYPFSKKPIILREDMKDSLLSLMNQTYPSESNKIPIIIKVNILKVSEWNYYGTAQVKLEFYCEKEGQLGKVFGFETATEMMLRNKEDHELNIKKAIEKCMSAFSESDWENIEPVWEHYSQVINQVEYSESVDPKLIADRREVILLSWTEGLQANGFEFSYFDYDVKQTGWNEATVIADEFYAVKRDQTVEPLFGIGIKAIGFHRIAESNWAVLIDSSVSSGLVIVSPLRLYMGLEFEQGLMYLPKSKFGIFGAANLYERLRIDSNYYWDIGIRASVGITYK